MDSNGRLSVQILTSQKCSSKINIMQELGCSGTNSSKFWLFRTVLSPQTKNMQIEIAPRGVEYKEQLQNMDKIQIASWQR